MPDRRSAMRALLAVGGLALLALGAHALPEPSPPKPGPALAEVQARGVLRVGVRAYPRPAPPGQPLPVEPDLYDADFAQALGARLGVAVQLVDVSGDSARSALAADRVDLIAAGVATWATGGTVATAYDDAPLRAVALRHTAVAAWDDLAGRTFCIAEGRADPVRIARALGATSRPYRSAVHAAAAFMAGECAAFVADAPLVDRLLQQPAWRFYVPLAGRPPAAEPARAVLAHPDPLSLRWLDAAVSAWRGGAWADALQRRTGTQSFEVALLQDGNVCH